MPTDMLVCTQYKSSNVGMHIDQKDIRSHMRAQGGPACAQGNNQQTMPYIYIYIYMPTNLKQKRAQKLLNCARCDHNNHNVENDKSRKLLPMRFATTPRKNDEN